MCSTLLALALVVRTVTGLNIGFCTGVWVAEAGEEGGLVLLVSNSSRHLPASGGGESSLPVAHPGYHFVQTWPDSECSHTVQCLDYSDLN